MDPALQSGCGNAPASMRKEDTPVNGLLEKLLTLPELRELAAEVHKTRCCAAVTGLSPVHRAMVAAALEIGRAHV